jgi:saccharopine dehydrogenase-like NADP-dependent oxidoreductase
MKTTKILARAACWRYWKQLQRVFEGVGQLTRSGFIFPKLQIMSTNNFSKETQLRLDNFFNEIIDHKSMAKTIRQVNHLLALNVMRDDGFMKTETINMEDSFFWLNELAETLDPYLIE